MFRRDQSIFLIFMPEIWWKAHFKKTHSGPFILLVKIYTLQENTPLLTCVNFIDHVTRSIGLWSLLTAWQPVGQPLLHPDLPKPSTHRHTVWLVDVLSLKPDMFHLRECWPALADYRMSRHSWIIYHRQLEVRDGERGQKIIEPP